MTSNSTYSTRGFLTLNKRLYKNQYASPEQYYDENSQAWRIIGTYLECEKGYGEDDDGNKYNGQKCSRTWLWAAYIDPQYKGNGLYEYQLYDTDSERWLQTCSSRDGRCVKMDCHEEHSHFELLGVYKFSYDDGDFMEQLFKHEGYCLWGEDTFSFMETARNYLPFNCNSTTVNNQQVYYDIKPLEYGKTTIGIYNDESCQSEYSGDITLEEMVESADNSGLDYLYQRLDDWDKAMARFDVCQPCVSYSLESVLSIRSFFSRRNLNEEEYHPYSCHDYAGANSVNQCMKFATQTDMEPAAMGDLERAHRQGTIRSITVGDVHYGPWRAQQSSVERDIRHAWIGLSISMIFFLMSFLYLIGQLIRKDLPIPEIVRRQHQKDVINYVDSKPLMRDSTATTNPPHESDDRKYSVSFAKEDESVTFADKKSRGRSRLRDALRFGRSTSGTRRSRSRSRSTSPGRRRRPSQSRSRSRSRSRSPGRR